MTKVIGDVHGQLDKYNEIINSCDESIQLGDFGFAKEHKWHRKNVNPNNHKILFGNHDDYTYLNEPHSLGNWHWDTDQDLFLIRGAESIDKHMRIQGLDWWEEEELSYNELLSIYDYYKSLTPKIVITHTCPNTVLRDMYGFIKSSTTTNALEHFWQTHQPELWIFGHHHRSYQKVINGTKFVCLNELETYELPKL